MLPFSTINNGAPGLALRKISTMCGWHVKYKICWAHLPVADAILAKALAVRPARSGSKFTKISSIITGRDVACSA